MWIALAATALVVLIAAGSSRSVGQASSSSRILDISPIVGDVLVLLGAVLVVEVGLLVYILVSSLRKRPGAALGPPKLPSSLLSRVLALLLPLMLIMVLLAVAARRPQEEDDGGILLPSLGPVVPPNGGAAAGAPFVVHWWALAGIGFVVVTAVAAVVVRRHLSRRRTEARQASRAADYEDLRAAVDSSLREIEDEADPRRAVINAYWSMEQVLAGHGLPRRSAETPLEYLARWTSILPVGRPAAEALAVLYERARFSLHYIDEDMRREARTALGALRTELGKGTS